MSLPKIVSLILVLILPVLNIVLLIFGFCAALHDCLSSPLYKIVTNTKLQNIVKKCIQVALLELYAIFNTKSFRLGWIHLFRAGMHLIFQICHVWGVFLLLFSRIQT